MPNNSFDTKKKQSSILDCFTYDLTTFFFDDYTEIASEETHATVMIVYEKILPWRELDIFDSVQFRIFFDKDTLTGSNPINVKFVSSEKGENIEEAKKIVQKVLSIYGADDFGKEEWTQEDTNLFRKKEFRKIWTIDRGESFVSVEHCEEYGTTLNILFFNNLVDANNEKKTL